MLQGRKKSNQWVTKFQVQYSNNGKTFIAVPGAYGGNGKKHNDEMSVETKVWAKFPNDIQTRYVRTIVKEWSGNISMRAGLFFMKQEAVSESSRDK